MCHNHYKENSAGWYSHPARWYRISGGVVQLGRALCHEGPVFTILLNDDFYKFMMAGRRVVDGIGVLGAEHLIPFKMYAWVNLLDRKRAGEHVNEKDLKKHKYDVFRLLQIVTDGTKVESEGLVTESIHRYIEEISAVDESEARLLQMGMPFDRDRGVELLKEIYL